MQHERGPKPRGDRNVTAGRAPSAPPEPPTAKWPVSSRLLRSTRWEEHDPLDDTDPAQRPSFAPADWDEAEIVTARRSIPRMPEPSGPWEMVRPEELISSIPPPPRISAPPSAPVRVSPLHIPSVGPVAIDTEPLRASGAPPTGPGSTDEDAEIDALLRRPTRGRWMMAAAAVAAVALVIGAGGLRAGAPKGPAPSMAAPATTSDLAEGLLPPPVPMVEEAAPVVPVPTTGTVAGVPGHRLYVDGRLVAGASTDVKCGVHAVKVGARGVARKVDVPCGGKVQAAQ